MNENRFAPQQPVDFRPAENLKPEKGSNQPSQYPISYTTKDYVRYSSPFSTYESRKVGDFARSQQNFGLANKNANYRTEFRTNAQNVFSSVVRTSTEIPYVNRKPISTGDNAATTRYSTPLFKEPERPSSSGVTNYGPQKTKSIKKQESKKIPVLLITLPHSKKPKTEPTKIQYDAWKPMTKETDYNVPKPPIQQPVPYSSNQEISQMNQAERVKFFPQTNVNFSPITEAPYGHSNSNFNNHESQQGNQFVQQSQNTEQPRLQNPETRQPVNQVPTDQTISQFDHPLPENHGNFNQNPPIPPPQQVQQNNYNGKDNFNRPPVHNQQQNFQNPEYRQPINPIISDFRPIQFEFPVNQEPVNFNQNPVEPPRQINIEPPNPQQNNYNENGPEYERTPEPNRAENFQNSGPRQLMNHPYTRQENVQIEIEKPTQFMSVNQIAKFNQEQFEKNKFQNYGSNTHDIRPPSPPPEEFNNQEIPAPNQGQGFQNQEYEQAVGQSFSTPEKTQFRLQPVPIPIAQIQTNFNPVQNDQRNYNRPNLEENPSTQQENFQKQEAETRNTEEHKEPKDSEGLLLVLVSTKQHKEDEVLKKQQEETGQYRDNQNVQLAADMNYSPSDRTSVVSFTKTNDYQTGYSIVY
ncbi:myb-like protein AA [Centruroides vittatus]|uniref:myb-like protein AA n=1 Tax=Centruroides vittatus TaxID=120091 RepID=UPI00350EB9FD